MSPPRMARPSRAMPSVMPRATEPTPAMVATPRAMQARKMPKPRMPAAEIAEREADRRRRDPSGAFRRRRSPPGASWPRGRRPASAGAASLVSTIARDCRRTTGRSARRGRVVGDQDQRHAALRLRGEQEIGDQPRRCRIEIAGRLVGEQHRRAGRPAPGRSPPAAARRRRARPDSASRRSARPTARSSRRRPREGVALPGELQRHGDVLERRHVRDEVEGLEDDADRRGRGSGASASSPSPVRSLPTTTMRPDCRPLEAGDRHEQRRLAAARRPDQADRSRRRRLRGRRP